MSKKEKYRGRVHMLLLYPDNEEHLNALYTIGKSYDYACCLHDRDTWTEADEKKDPKHKAGDFKKPHFHVIVRTPNATWNTALCKALNIDEQFCEQPENFERSLQYLIHYNDADKAQYAVEDVTGPLRTKLIESINKVEKSEGEKVTELIQFIEEYDGYLTVKEFAKHCAQNGFWAEFRRSGAIFCKIIEEKNQEFRQTN